MTFTVKEVSHAIRINGVEQIQGDYIRDYGKGPVGACALGQAAINLTDDIEHVYDTIDVIWNALKLYKVDCPENHWDEPYYGPRYLADLIIHLNDRHEWTFEQIADFLDAQSIEENRVQ